MGKTRNNSGQKRQSFFSAGGFANLRPTVRNLPAQQQPQEPVVNTLDQAKKKFAKLSASVYGNWQAFTTAIDHSGLADRTQQQDNNLLDSKFNGYAHWYHQGLVYSAPVDSRGQADLENVFVCGDSDGAELDVYGLDCQIAAALCRRVGDRDSESMYRLLADDYYQQAAASGYMNWPDPADRPKIPEIL